MFSVLMSEGRKKRDYKIGSENNKSAYKTSFWEEVIIMKLIRRTIPLFLMIGIILSLNVVIFAAEIDLSGYTDNEIIALNKKVQQELADRKIKATAEVTAGTYIAGKDFPVGTFDMTLLWRDSFSTVAVIPSDLAGTEIKNTDDYSFYIYPGADDVRRVWSLEVKEGDELRVDNCKISLTTASSGITFK